MDKHYFTLGAGYPEKVQVIYADSEEKARESMFTLHGWNWAFQYTEQEWKQSINNGYFKGATYLSHEKKPR